ncbi:MAG: EI24 domain-containing protein [Alphaproteobacteria bacterium]
MIAALGRAFGQLGDPAIRGVLWIGGGAALALIVAFTAGATWAMTGIEIPGFGWVTGVIQVLGGFTAFVLSLYLFPGVVGVVTSLLLDRVAEAVERRHYPDLGPARSLGVGASIGIALRFLAVLIVFNLLALVAGLIVPPLGPLLFYAVNGYLLGREYFELVAFRRADPAAAQALRRRNAGRVFWAGVVIAVLVSVPVLNLLVPVVGTAFMVHIFQSLAGSRAQAAACAAGIGNDL